MKKNINILRIDFDIDEQGNFDEINIRTNIDLPMEFNNELNDMFVENIDKAVEKIKNAYGDNARIFDIFATALYKSKMSNNSVITNEQFKNAREIEYKRREDNNE